MQQVNQAVEHALADGTMTSEILICSGHDGGSNPGERHDVRWFPFRIAGRILVSGGDDSTLDKLQKMGLQVDEFVGSCISTATETSVDPVDDTFLRDDIGQSVDGDLNPLRKQLVRADSGLDSMAGDSHDGSNVKVIAIELKVSLPAPQIMHVSQELECCAHMSRSVMPRQGHDKVEAANYIISQPQVSCYCLRDYQGFKSLYKGSIE